MATVNRYQGGGVQPINTAIAPLTGQVFAQPTNAIGDALKQVGDVGTRMYVAYQQANDARNMLEAENEMQSEMLDFAKWQQANADESKWLPEWEKRTKKLEDSIGKRPLTDQARLAMTRSFGRWSTNETMSLQSQAVKQAGQRARMAAQNTITRAIEQGDETTAMAAVETLGASGVMFPEEVDATKLELAGTFKSKRKQDALNFASEAVTMGDFETAMTAIREAPFTESEKRDRLANLRHQKEVSELVTIANDDPKKAMELATAGEAANRITGPDRIKIVSAAESRLKELRTDSLKTFTDEIKLGVADKEKFAGRILDNPHLTASDKAALSAFLDQGPVNDPVSYARLFADAKQFEGKEGSPEYAQFLARVDMALDGDAKSSVLGALGESIKGPVTAQTRAFNEVYGMAADDLKNGLFGDYLGKLEDPQTALPSNLKADIRSIRDALIEDAGEAEKKRVASDPKRLDYWERRAREAWWEKRPDKGDSFTAYAVEDELKKREASKRYQDALASLEKWKAENPKATPSELRSQYERYLARQRASEFSNPLLPSATPAPRLDLNEILKRHATNPGK